MNSLFIIQTIITVLFIYHIIKYMKFKYTENTTVKEFKEKLEREMILNGLLIINNIIEIHKTDNITLKIVFGIFILIFILGDNHARNLYKTVSTFDDDKKVEEYVNIN